MIMNVFSPLWLMWFGLDIVLVVVLSLLLRKKTADFKAKVMGIMAIANCAIWVVYKFLLSRDPSFDFVFVLELPFHLCNLNLMLLVVAIYTRRTGFLNFCFCFGIVGSVLAMMSPDPYFLGISLLNYNRVGYWIYHHILFVQSILIVSSGFYRPSYREVPKSIVILMVMYFCMYLVNMLMRRLTGLPVNYLYTFGMQGNTLIEMLYKLLPVYPIYLLPALVAVTPVLFGIVALGRIGKPCPDTIQS